MAEQISTGQAKLRCQRHRIRMLELSQTVGALHIAPALSCLEIVDIIYAELMHKRGGETIDTFILSKGHGALAQYVVLEDQGILPKSALDNICKSDGILGTHPDLGNPGIEASTGSLGHGLGMAVGMACADKIRNSDRQIYVVISDGELQEGSSWEAIMLAPSLKIRNLCVFLDLNDFQSMARTSQTHPNFYPVKEKLLAFGWEAVEVDGHNSEQLYSAVKNRKGGPLMVIAKTTKGKGISFMENSPIWHYRSPNPSEYQQALAELKGGV